MNIGVYMLPLFVLCGQEGTKCAASVACVGAGHCMFPLVDLGIDSDVKNCMQTCLGFFIDVVYMSWSAALLDVRDICSFAYGNLTCRIVTNSARSMLYP